VTAAKRAAPRRERARAATIDEIKLTALALMREHGAAAVRFTDIARAMELTPPALYRYFADRDELLNALITDAFDDLGQAVAQAQAAVADDDLGGRWLAAAQAFRHWAVREPQAFSLIFGLPLPGYVAPEDGPTTEAAQRAFTQLASMFVEAQRRGELGPPLIRTVHPAVADCAGMKESTLSGAIPPVNFQAMMHAWAALHGFTSLEAYGHLQWLPPEARDELFRTQVWLAASAAGMPVPRTAEPG
jgi:AcrR family transcriptional regulator